MNQKQKQERLDVIDWNIQHERFTGTTTRHTCYCGRLSCRTSKCWLCWEEERKELTQ